MDAYQPDPSGPRSRWSREREGSWLGWGVVFIVALVAAVVVFLSITSEPPQRVAIADLEDPASPMTGESVTVEGEVDEKLSEQALTVRDGESDEPLLVIVHPGAIIDGTAPVADQMDPLGGADPDPVTGPGQVAPVTVIPSSGPVRIVGMVDTFDRAIVSEGLGITLSEGMFGSFEGDPYLRAEVIETSFDPSTLPPAEPPSATIAD